MLVRCSRAWTSKYSAPLKHRLIKLRHFSEVTKALKPGHDDRLRILFCGADPFSVRSLRALTEYYRSPGTHIDSINVITKKDKRTGRGLKTTSSTAVKKAAIELELPVHQIDTFTGWSPPSYGFHPSPYINLVVAVSFGLLIPARILNACKYGGLNVHPSMLPEYKGAAPIQWQIMRGETHTGISVQTLHPSRFDEGIVLDQTPQPGIAIPNPDTCTFGVLRDFLAPIGAEMLVKTIKNRLYIPPYKDVKQVSPRRTLNAPKITTSTKAEDFSVYNSERILRRNRAIPKLWAIATVQGGSRSVTRVLFEADMHATSLTYFPRGLDAEALRLPPGLPYAILDDREDVMSTTAALMINTTSGCITIPTITVAGSTAGPAVAAAARGGLLKKTAGVDGSTLYTFHERLRKPQPEKEDGFASHLPIRHLSST